MDGGTVVNALRNFFSILYGVGYIGNSWLFLATVWSYLGENLPLSLIQIINPLMYLGVILSLLASPAFWLLTGATILGLVGSQRLANAEESRQSDVVQEAWEQDEEAQEDDVEDLWEDTSDGQAEGYRPVR